VIELQRSHRAANRDSCDRFPTQVDSQNDIVTSGKLGESGWRADLDACTGTGHVRVVVDSANLTLMDHEGSEASPRVLGAPLNRKAGRATRRTRWRSAHFRAFIADGDQYRSGASTISRTSQRDNKSVHPTRAQPQTRWSTPCQ
jgi:hypothetical protein